MDHHMGVGIIAPCWGQSTEVILHITRQPSATLLEKGEVDPYPQVGTICYRGDPNPR